MTEQIKSAIKGLNEVSTMYGHKWIRDDCELAIRSLQAWDEVLQELEEQKIAFYQNGAFLTSNAIQSVIDFIKQKLSEIEEVR